jgi:hypothetical protein
VLRQTDSGGRFTRESLSSHHFKNFNLLHSEILGTSEDQILRNARIVCVTITQSRVAAGAAVAFVANMDVVTITECWAVRAIRINRTLLVFLFDNPWTEIVGILERERETLQSRIRSVVISRAPGDSSILHKPTEQTSIRTGSGQ